METSQQAQDTQVRGVAQEEKIYRVLHVDDDEDFLHTFREIYGSYLQITSEPGGEAALAALESLEVDAVILDYEMPRMNGLETLRAIRKKFPLLPVIFYTGQGDEEVARQAFIEGATDYFVKGFSLIGEKEKLVNSIKRSLEERALKYEYEKQRVMLENIITLNPYAMMICDRDGRFVRANRAHTKLFSATPDWKEGIILYEPASMPAEQFEEYRKMSKELLKTWTVFNDPNFQGQECIERWKNGETVRFPYIWYDARKFAPLHSGEPVCSSGTSFSIKNEKGEIEYYVSMHEDVTEKVKAEEGLKKAHDELETRVLERTQDLNEANSKLRDEIVTREHLQQELLAINQELEEFASRVSHGLRNSLLVMRQLAETAQQEPESLKENLASLENSSDELMDYVERLLDLARSGKAIDRKEQVDLGPLLNRALAKVTPADLEVSISPSLPPVWCDPVEMEHLFLNLVQNAVQHRDPGKEVLKISLDYRMDHDRIELNFSDNGLGIEHAILEKVFTPAFTTDRTRRHGFGLAIVKKIAEVHGGAVKVESEGAGKGAAFIISLPA